jgi:hypothetical protein
MVAGEAEAIYRAIQTLAVPAIDHNVTWLFRKEFGT